MVYILGTDILSVGLNIAIFGKTKGRSILLDAYFHDDSPYLLYLLLVYGINNYFS